MQHSLQLYLFGRKNAESFIKGEIDPESYIFLSIIKSLKATVINYMLSSYAELKVDKKSVGGCGGIIGRKKGAVAIRINYKGIRMVFISCHLSGNY